MSFEAENVTVRFSLAARNGTLGDEDARLSWDLYAPRVYQTQHTLAAGANTFSTAVPSDTYQLVIIEPPASTSDTWALKGVAGDTGLTVGTAKGPIVLSGLNPASFVLSATTGAYTILITWVR